MPAASTSFSPPRPPAVRPSLRDGSLVLLFLLVGVAAGRAAADRDRLLPLRVPPAPPAGAGLARAAFGVG